MISLFDAWQPQIRKLALTGWGEGRTLLAIAGAVPDCGVTTLCRGLARYAVQAGRRTVLLSFAEPLPDARASGLPPPPSSPDPQPDPEGFDVLRCALEAGGASITDIAQLRAMVETACAAYGCVVADIAPINELGMRCADGAAAAAACKRIFLVAPAGRIDTSGFLACLNLLASSRVELAGVIVNDRFNPTLAAEMAREARRLRFVSPRLSRWLARKALASRFLSDRA